MRHRSSSLHSSVTNSPLGATIVRSNDQKDDNLMQEEEINLKLHRGILALTAMEPPDQTASFLQQIIEKKKKAPIVLQTPFTPCGCKFRNVAS